MSFDQDVRDVLDSVAVMLAAKNDAYGNSALDPVRIFSQASPEEQLRVRLDDKLSRLARGSAAGEDVVMDLLGYLVLLRIVQVRKSSNGGLVQLKGGLSVESGGSAAGCRVVETTASGCRVIETPHEVWQGPYIGLFVANKITEKAGKIVVDDNENIVVEWGVGNQGTFARKVFEEGLKEGWLKFSGEKEDGR